MHRTSYRMSATLPPFRHDSDTQEFILSGFNGAPFTCATAFLNALFRHIIRITERECKWLMCAPAAVGNPCQKVLGGNTKEDINLIHGQRLPMNTQRFP